MVGQHTPGEDRFAEFTASSQYSFFAFGHPLVILADDMCVCITGSSYKRTVAEARIPMRRRVPRKMPFAAIGDDFLPLFGRHVAIVIHRILLIRDRSEDAFVVPPSGGVFGRRVRSSAFRRRVSFTLKSTA